MSKERTNLIYYLGKSPEIKVLDFLIENRRTAWNITEIETQGEIARSTIKLVIPKLIKLNLIKIEMQVGNSKLYMVNLDNEIVKKIVSLSSLIDKIELKNKKLKKK